MRRPCFVQILIFALAPRHAGAFTLHIKRHMQGTSPTEYDISSALQCNANCSGNCTSSCEADECCSCDSFGRVGNFLCNVNPLSSQNHLCDCSDECDDGCSTSCDSDCHLVLPQSPPTTPPHVPPPELLPPSPLTPPLQPPVTPPSPEPSLPPPKTSWLPKPSLPFVQLDASAKAGPDDAGNSHLVILIALLSVGICVLLIVTIAFAVGCIWMHRRNQADAASIQRHIRETEAHNESHARRLLRVMLNLKRQVQPLVIQPYCTDGPYGDSGVDNQRNALGSGACAALSYAENGNLCAGYASSGSRAIQRQASNQRGGRKDAEGEQDSLQSGQKGVVYRIESSSRRGMRQSMSDSLLRPSKRIVAPGMTAGTMVAREAVAQSPIAHERRWLAQREQDVQDSKLTARELAVEIIGTLCTPEPYEDGMLGDDDSLRESTVREEGDYTRPATRHTRPASPRNRRQQVEREHWCRV